MKKIYTVLYFLLFSGILFAVTPTTRESNLTTGNLNELKLTVLSEKTEMASLPAAIELSGNYTIGTSGDYSTIAEAVTSVSTEGIAGPVVFSIEDGIYNEQITLGPIPGASSTNTITFESQSSNPDNVTIQYSPTGASDNFVILLENASHFIFQNITIQATGTTYARTLRGQLELHNILVEGCVLKSPNANNTSSDRGNVVFTTVNSSEIRFLNNTFLGGSYGIYFQGTNSGSVRALGFQFTGNTIRDSYYRGISFSRFLDCEIEENTIEILPASSSSSDGIELSYLDGETRIVGNRISGSKSAGLEYTFSSGSGTTPGLIANNYIQSSGSYAFYFYYNTNQRIYHNSLNNTGNGVGLHYNGSGSSNNLIKNNIFKASTGYAIDVTSSTGLGEMDYNNLYTSGTYLAKWGNTNVADLRTWQGISSFDDNSLSFNPQYLSETDLTAGSPALANAGISVSEVTTDIDGVARKATPSMGANEYDSGGLTPLSGIYTINPSVSDVRNFTTIQSTVDAMVLNGISGAVTFQLASGTYTEQVVIPDISGGSSSNTVTYESASADREDVIIEFAATETADNYVILLDNASDLIFRNLTLRALGSGFGITISSVNRLDNLLVENCDLLSPDFGGRNFNAGNVNLQPSISTDVKFIGNRITGGDHGIYYKGGNGSSYRAPGTEIRDNEITGMYAYGLYLNFLTGTQVEDNTVTMRNSAWGSSYIVEMENVEGSVRVTGNRLTGSNSTGLRFQFNEGDNTTPGLIANNYIQSSGSYAFYFYYNTNQRIYHNSLNNTGTGVGLHYNGSGSSNNLIKNNIFKASTGYAIDVTSSTGLGEMDYNNLYTSGTYLAKWGNTNVADLRTWQGISSFDDNSLSFNPQYLSETDLTAGSPALANAGISVSEVTTDIDGVARKATPSMGANEYDSGGLTPLSGIYTINPSVSDVRNFTTIQSTVDAMVLNGISGAVTFQLASGTYTEQVVIPDISGGSSSNTVTYESASADREDVIIEFAATETADNYVVLLDNASDLIFRNLTLRALGSGFGITISSVNRLDNLLVENCDLLSPDFGGRNFNAGNVNLQPSISTDVKFIGNRITGGDHGIYYKGGNGSSYRAPGTEIRDNEITGMYAYGLYLNFLTGTQVEDNTVTMRNSAWGSSYIVEMENVEGSVRVTGNRLTGSNSTGLRFQFNEGDNTTPGLIANNYIQSSGSYAFYFYYNTNQRIYHNSLNNTGTGVGLHYNGSGSSNNLIKNNIFKASTGYAIDVTSSTGLGEMDYNNLYTSGTYLAKWGNTNVADLRTWQGISSFDDNSLSFNPQYLSETDLTAGSPALANAGISVSEVTTDIDGVARKATPSMGANEYDSGGLTPLSGIYTINPSVSDVRNFTTIQSTVDAMVLNGISGAVTFQLASGTYTEQVVIPDISGGSSSNTVTYESASADREDVIIEFAATETADNYVILLDNASDLIFRNLTLRALGSGFGITISSVNRLDNLLVENCDLLSPDFGGRNFNAGNVNLQPSISTDVKFIGNRITGGDHGIYYKGGNGSSYRAPGTEIRDNEITGMYAYGLYLNFLTGTQVEDNTVTMRNSAWGSSYIVEMENVEGSVRVTGNRLTGSNSTGLRFQFNEGDNTTPGLIANNYIQSSGSYAFYFYYNTNQRIYHNSLNNTGTGVGLHYNGSGSSNNLIKNNIFKASTGYAIDVTSSTGLGEMDYNNLYTSGTYLAKWGNTNVADLVTWQGISSKDANSLNTDPQYVSDTDLLAQSPSLTEAGVDLTSIVSIDINGNARTVPVSIGANEFAIAGEPLIGDYTIDPDGSGIRNFTSFASVSEALTLNGISGVVRFLVADGTYNDQVNLGTVSGVSETFTITFESENGNPDLVIVQHTTDYTLKLTNAEHYIFKNLTFKTTGAAQVVQVRNRANNLLFEGNRIISPIEAGTSTARKGFDISPTFAQDIRVINNTITGGFYGLYFKGSSSSNMAAGTIISGNSVTDAHFHSIYLQYHEAAVITENVVQTNSTADQISIFIDNTSGGLILNKNRVSSNDGNALRLTNIQGSAANTNLVSNNFFESDGTNRAIYVNNSTYLHFYHNAVWNQSSGAAFEYVSSGSENKLVNNIFQSANGYSLNISNTAAISESNYNDLFTGGTKIGRWGTTDVSDLASWKSTSSQDANSLTVNANFVSVTDLTPQTDALAENGTDITGTVSSDINGTIRTIPISIGAVEFFAVAGMDLAIKQIVSPQSNCLLTDQETVTIQIENIGSSFAGNIEVAYQLNSLAPVIQSLPTDFVLAPGQIYEFSFDVKLDLSSKEEYQLKTYLTQTDATPENNEQIVTVSHFPGVLATISDDVSVCSGIYATLTATGGTSYFWSNGQTTSTIYVNPAETTNYTVLVSDANGCSIEKSVTVTVLNIPELAFAGDANYLDTYVSPLVGVSSDEFTFRVLYTDVDGILPAVGFPKVILQSFLETLEFEMTEEDAADVNVQDGKVYFATVSGLSADVVWQSKIEVENENGCSFSTNFVEEPLVSKDLLDLAIFATDILFSNDEPAINETFTITANVSNTSDFTAENVQVDVYDDLNLIYSNTIPLINPQSTVPFNFDYVFPVSGYHEIKVVLDEPNTIEEKNELNNFAIRFYALPEGINVSASTSKTTYKLSESIFISGFASYFGLDAAITPKVKNATVRWTVSDGRNKTTLTSSNGTFSTSFTPFNSTGIYTVSGEVDDDRFVAPFGPFQISVVENPITTNYPDLSAAISLNYPPGRNYFIEGELVSGVAKVINSGQLEASNFVFRYSSCDGVLGEILIPNLAPGEFIEYPFVTLVSTVNGCSSTDKCTFSATADALYQVSEIREDNNYNYVQTKIYSSKPDLDPIISGSTTFNLEDNYYFTARVYNYGGVSPDQSFTLNVYLDGVLFDSKVVQPINRCASTYFSFNNLFTTTEDHIITVKVDEPLGSGVIDENNELNNQDEKTITYKPKKPDLLTNQYSISVSPKIPLPGENFTLTAAFSNKGATSVINPFQNKFSLTEDGITRTENISVTEVLAKGQSSSSTYITNISAYGNHSVQFSVDSENDIEESTESNNTGSMPLCVDLKASRIPSNYSSIWNGNFQVFTQQYLTAYIGNNGLFIPSNVPVNFYLDDVLIASSTLDEVPSSYNTQGIYVSLPYIFPDAGVHTLKVIVDEDNSYIECDETNNEYSQQITINTPGPDLRVLTQYISPTKINPDLNEPINLFVSFDNIGAVPAGPFKVRLTIDDVPIGEDVLVDGVDAGEDGTVAITAPYSSAIGGVKTLKAYIDVENQQQDPNRDNNTAIRTIFVGDAPNLLFTDMTFSNDCPANGEAITVTVGIQNEGDVATDATLTFYHKSGETLDEISQQAISVDAKGQISISVDASILSNTFELFAEITDAYPYEYNVLDNTIQKAYCTNAVTEYTLITDVSGSGIITRNPNENLYPENSEVTLSATPANGWVFNEWLGDAAGNTNPLVVNMNANKNITARFTEEFRVDLNITNESCVGAANGGIVASVFSGTAPYSYEWKKNGDLLTETTSSLQNLSAAQYLLTITDSNNETISETIDLIVSDFEAPNISIFADIQVLLDENGNGVLTVPEVDNGSVDNCGIANQYFNENLSTINFTCADIGSPVSVTYKVEDTNGNIASKEIFIEVLDDVAPVISTTTDINQRTDADECGAVINIPEPIVTDNCGVLIATGTRSDGLDLSEAFPVGETTISWTASDASLNEATPVVQKVNVSDDENPVVNTQDLVVDLNASGTVTITEDQINNGSTDNCGIDFMELSQSIFTCANLGANSVTLTITDIHGNTASSSATITVQDILVPVISAISDINQSADAGECGVVINLTAPTVTDNCGILIATGTRNDGLDLSDAFPVGETTITWNALDASGNEAIPVVQKVNVPLVLEAIGNKSVDEESMLTFITFPNQQDCPEKILAYHLDASAVSEGMEINPTSGEFSWTPTELQGGSAYSVTITVTDNGINPSNLSDSETITITVNEVNVAPILATIGNKFVNEQSVLSFTAAATDSDLPSQTLTFSLDAASVSNGMSINPSTGEFSWTPSELQGGADYSVTITVTDNGTNPSNLSDSETITITVNEVNVAPILAAIGNKFVNEQSVLSFTAAATDQDLPSQSLTFSLDATSISAGMTIDPTTGEFSWAPDESQGGADYSVTITVTDNGINPSNLSDSETITITVNEVNVAPILATIGNKFVNEQSVLSFTAAATDQDLPSQSLTFSLDAASELLGMTINSSTGVFSWTPDETLGGFDFQVTITVTDNGTSPNNLSDSETFTITVNDVLAINTAPELSAIGNKIIDEETELTFTAAAVDSDVPAQTLTFSLDAASVLLGMTIDETSGEFSWTPTESEGGANYEVTITVTDNGTNPDNLSDFETFTILVNEVNSIPELSTIGNQNVDEGTQLAFTAIANDSDVPAQNLTFSLDATSVLLGMTIDPTTGEFSWTPTESEGGSDYEVTITVTDNGANPDNLSDLETFTILVNEVNSIPELSTIGNQYVDEGTQLAFTAIANDSDVPAQNLTFSLDATSVLLGMTIDPTTGEFSWAPDESQGGADYSVTITVTDNGTNPSNLSDSETITITVNEVNVAPILATIGNKFVNEQSVLSFTAAATDQDLPSQSLTFSLDAASELVGMTINSSTGVFSWTPDETLGGFDFQVTITVTDNGTSPNNLSDSETFTITVNEVLAINTAPELLTIGNQNIDEETQLTFTATASDSDVPAQTLTYSLDAASELLGMTINPTTGEFSWMPTDLQGGSDYEVTITVTDNGTNPDNLSDSETFTIIVNDVLAINTTPELSAIGNKTIDEETELTFTAAAVDSDVPAQTLTFSLDAASELLGMSIDPTTGEFSWTPTELQGGTDFEVTITVTDNGTNPDNLSDFETFTISVNEVNSTPELSTIGNQNIDEETELTFTATANDSDVPVQTLTFSLDATSVLLGMTIDETSGEFRWTPTESEGGADYEVTITVTDNGTNPDNLSDSETFTIIVNDVLAINTTPELSAIGNKTIDEETELTFTAAAVDSDVPAQTLTFSLDAASELLGMTIDPTTGEFSWTPTELQGGTDFEVTITVTDNGTNPDNLSDSETFTITVNEVLAINTAPELLTIGNQNIDEGTQLAFTATANDSDVPAQTLTFSLDATSVLLGMTIDETSGEFRWTPTESEGGADYEVTITVTDNGTNPDNLSNLETFTISVNEVNSTPELSTIGNQSIDEQATLSFTASGIDQDFPAQNLTFSLDATSVLLGMTINPTTGEFSWTPTESQGGADYEVTIIVTDNGTNPDNLSDSETFTITVNDVLAINTAPELLTVGNQNIDEGTQLAFTATANDSDVPAQTLTFSLDATSVLLGMTIDATSGEFSWTPTESEGGADYEVTITVTDNGTNPDNLSDSETTTITVNEVNVAPILAAIGNKFVNEQSVLSFTAAATDQDLPSQSLTFSLDAASELVGMTINSSTGVFSWTPDETLGGFDFQVTITVTDNGTSPNNLSDSETFTITVNEVLAINTAPELLTIGNQNIDEGTQLAFTATANDSDVPAQTLTFSLDATSVLLGMTIDATSGEFSWTPTESEGGADYEVTITVTDNGTNPDNLSDSETITITVNEVNVAPILAAIGNKFVNEQSVLSFTAAATDQDLPSQSLTFSLDAASELVGMTINSSTGVFSWTPDETLGGFDFQVTITVTDNGTSPNNLSDSETFTITVNEVLAINTAPELLTIGNQNIDEGTQLAFTAAAVDSDVPAQTLTFSLDAASILAGMTIDPTTGEFSWAPAESQGGADYSVTITVTDNGTNPDNLSDSEIFTITVNEKIVDCVLSDWSDWSECDATCGGGQQFRTREVLVASANNGAPCGELIEYRECNTQACPEDPYTVLSNYALIAEQEIHLDFSNRITSGGAGVTATGGKIKLHHTSYITDFARASKIETYFRSWVGEKVYSPALIAVPVFIYNTASNNKSGDVKVRNRRTEILDGEVYGKVEVQDGAKVTFTASNIYLDELELNGNSTVEFAGCANVFINKKLNVGYNSRFNSAGNSVRVYVDGNVFVYGGSSVTAQIHTTKDIHAMGWFFWATKMNGLFIAKKIHGFINVEWSSFQFPFPCEIQDPILAENMNDNDCDDDDRNKKDKEKNHKSGLIISEIAPFIGNPEMKAYPNPFSEKLHFEFVSPLATHAKIDVYDMTGRKIQTVFDAEIESNVTYNADFEPSTEISGMYLYRMTLGEEVFNGKVIYKK